VANKEKTKNGALPPELEAERKKAAKQAKVDEKKAAKQKIKEARAVRQGVKAARGKKTSYAGALFAGFFYGVFFFLLLITAGVAFYYFDLGNVRNMVIGGLGIDRDSYAILENRRNEISGLEAKIAEEQQKLQAEKTTLIQTEEALNTREDELDQKQQALENQEALLSGQATELSRIIELYESMDTAAAAVILSEFERDQDVIRILRSISQSKASQILAQIDPARASEITTLMLSTATESTTNETEEDQATSSASSGTNNTDEQTGG
jgi:flagellar motility protein MotE (MotC chaperone)